MVGKKTRMCSYVFNNEQCPHGSCCRYAHQENELSQLTSYDRESPLFRKRPCRYYTTMGKCPFGSQCIFAHSDHSADMNHQVRLLMWNVPLKEALPLILNVRLQEISNQYVVSMRYELRQTKSLNNVEITFPLPADNDALPIVTKCEGSYIVSKDRVTWCIGLVDKTNASESLVFSIRRTPVAVVREFFPVPQNVPGDLFTPIRVSYDSSHLYSNLSVESVAELELKEPVNV